MFLSVLSKVMKSTRTIPFSVRFVLLLSTSGFFAMASLAQPLEAPDTVQSFPAGHYPQAMAFDGSNLWIHSANYAEVTKLRASDGALLGTFDSGGYGYGAAYDGENVWLSNSEPGTVTKLRASDGTIVDSFPVGFELVDVLFDGTNIWEI